MTAKDAYEIGYSDGVNYSGAIGGDSEYLVPDDVYPAYARGVHDGIANRDGYRATFSAPAVVTRTAYDGLS